jgi:2-dehydro-3-deoxyphosphogluconate aldolase/(4S)-4-hydroxy-2-oxoglutarate aldolase
VTADHLIEAGLIAIIRADSSDHLIDAARALWEGGVRAMEVTLNTPGALKSIEQIRDKMPEMICGAGTILQVDDAVAASHAGAQFIITPTLQLDTVAFCKGQGLPVSPGCTSPTEMLAGQRAGADFIKVFPANRFGLEHIAAVLRVMPQLKLVPTGGVTPDNVHRYFEVGCPMVAAGATLVSKQVIAQRDWPALTALAQRFTSAVAAARKASEGR